MANSIFNDDSNFANNGAQFEINEYSPSSSPSGVCGTAIITQGPVAGSCAELTSGEGAGSGSVCGIFYQVYINEDGTCDALNGDPIVQAGRVRLYGPSDEFCVEYAETFPTAGTIYTSYGPLATSSDFVEFNPGTQNYLGYCANLVVTCGACDEDP